MNNSNCFVYMNSWNTFPKPTYNRGHAIKHAVDSVLKQTFQDFEIIIIDDASTDQTKEVVALIEDDRIHYILNQTNQERCGFTV